MKKIKTIFLLGLFLCCLIFVNSYAVEADKNFSQTTNETLRIADLQLQLEKQRYEWAEQDLQRSKIHQKQKQQYFKAHSISSDDLNRISALINNSKTALGNIQIAVADANENILFTENELSEMTKHPERITQAVQGKEVWESLLKIQQQRLDYLNRTEDLTSLHLQQLQSWQQDLNQWYQVQKHQQDEFSLAAYQEKLQITQQQLLQKLTNLTNELNTIDPAKLKKGQRANLQFQIFMAQEKLSINHLQLFLTQLQNRVHTIAVTLPESNTISDLQDRQDEASSVLTKVVHVKAVVKEKLKLLQSHLKTLTKSDATFGAYQSLIQEYQDEYQKINNLQTHIDNYQEQISDMLAHRFTIRQTLPGVSLLGWIHLGQQILLMPKMTADVAQELVKELWLQFKFQRSVHFYLFVFMELVLLISWWFLRKTFRQLFWWLAESSRRFSGQLLRTFLVLIGNNLGIIWIVIAISLIYFIFGIVQVTLFLSIAVIYFFYQVLKMLLKMCLLENVSATKKYEKLYSQLRTLLNMGALLTTLVTFAYFLPVDYEVKTLMNKLFMVFLLIGSFVLFRAGSRLPAILQQVFAVRRNYILQVIRLICLVLPVTLLMNAVIGLIGYIDLAWKIGGYQISTFIILSAYMIARGILIDFMELNYELLIRHFQSGWLWAQSLIRPLDRLLRIILFFVALTFLLHNFSLDHNRAFISHFHNMLSTPLINFGKSIINLNVLIGAFFYIAFLFWLAKWSREFAFRWFFSHTKDIGLRNSLAVFTQYIAIMIALLLGLKIFGLDLKGLAVVAAAFAAGMGFALRDLASNFISGIMLLIERPFRTGDTITLGEHEGEVVGTGMRSMKIQTWDHTEVIVPNADMFTKPFVNWTHQDSIVRSVIKISVNREDDPHAIQKIIYEVLKFTPDVVKTPASEVFIKEISDTLLEFEVRYYVDMKEIESRSRVRSDVLFGIWDAFRKNNIQTPYTRYDVQVLK